ncbi:MAG: hypothetical protein K8T89_14125 [Planctomycetes bacterium]|nr:hypothetical protein [Planctomycetota bacterium]
MKLLRPFSITAGTVALVAAWCWLDMSTADYRAGGFFGGRTTAGWFVIGSPFLLVFALGVSLVFSLIARRFGTRVGWACLLVVFVPLTAIAYFNTTPAARVRAALDLDPPAGTQIFRIAQFDSFNEGISIYGVCSADAPFVDKLIAAKGLKPSDPHGLLPGGMQEESIPPENAAAYSGNRLAIFYDADLSRLYFYRRFGQPRP